MRRDLSLVGLSLVAYACALVLGSLAIWGCHWLWEPIDAAGEPMRDKHSADPRLRARPILGISLLDDFRHGVNAEAMEGRIYNPENGQVWRRLESVCAMHPKHIDALVRSR